MEWKLKVVEDDGMEGIGVKEGFWVGFGWDGWLGGVYGKEVGYIYSLAWIL